MPLQTPSTGFGAAEDPAGVSPAFRRDEDDPVVQPTVCGLSDPTVRRPGPVEEEFRLATNAASRGERSARPEEMLHRQLVDGRHPDAALGKSLDVV